MLVRLLLLFISLPLVELVLLLYLAAHTGFVFTLGLVIFTGVLGAWLARREGLQCWIRVQNEIAQGQLPADSLLDGLIILVAGALLITPGVLTDLTGFALLVPPLRRQIKKYVAGRIRGGIVVAAGSPPPSGATPDDVIDAEHFPSDED